VKGRHVHVALAAALLASAGLVTQSSLGQQERLLLFGDVRMTTSPDGLTTAVVVDRASADLRSDGVIDHGFRLQRKLPEWFDYDGLGTIAYTDSGLAILTDDGTGWVFALEGTSTPPVEKPDAACTVHMVVGLSHQWGHAIQRTHEEAISRLLGPDCATRDAEANCDPCEAGGSGTSFCDVECGDGGCSANCSPGLFACCNCPDGCRCCAPREQLQRDPPGV